VAATFCSAQLDLNISVRTRLPCCVQNREKSGEKCSTYWVKKNKASLVLKTVSVVKLMLLDGDSASLHSGY